LLVNQLLADQFVHKLHILTIKLVKIRNFIFLILLMAISLTGISMVIYRWFTDQTIWNSGVLALLSIFFLLIVFITYLWSFLYIARQRKISQLKTDYINHMTHEFKTPITTISLATDSILSEEVINDENRIRYYANMVKMEILRMNEQVNRLLQAARLEREELDFKYQIVNAHDKIEEAIQGIRIQIDKKNGRIIKNLTAANPNITTDPIHFMNIINNLLDNANKYSPEAPEITITTKNDRKGLYVLVEDKGMGMSKKIQDKIFERFYRLSLLPGTKGFGLGLSYIKSILKINKGQIKVKSEPGKGSQFTVFIPFYLKGHKTN
jgi:two-component system, OmpR family, phosphate regulon sensor histidine kinase PhoR